MKTARSVGANQPEEASQTVDAEAIVQQQAISTVLLKQHRRPMLTDRWMVFVFVAPTIVLLLFIGVFPLFWSLYLSFTTYSAEYPIAPVWVGLGNYLQVFSDANIWRYFTITAKFVVLAVGIEFFLGFGLALLLNRKFPGRGMAMTLLLSPMMLAPVVVGLFWKFMLSEQFGVVDWFISQTGACKVTINCPDWLNNSSLALWSMVIADVWMWTPFMLLIALAGLSAIPRYLYEAADVDRASAWFKFRHITFPLVWPLLIIGLLFRTMDAFRVFDLPFALTGGGPGDSTYTVSYQLYQLAFSQSNTGYSCALGYVMLIVVIAIANIYIRYLNRATQTVHQG